MENRILLEAFDKFINGDSEEIIPVDRTKRNAEYYQKNKLHILEVQRLYR